MTLSPQSIDPVDLAEVRRHLERADPESRLVPLDIKRLSIDMAAHRQVGDAVDEVVGRGSDGDGVVRVVMLVDATPIQRAGEDYKQQVERELASRFSVTRVVLDDGHPTLHADEAVLDEATAAVADADCVVAVGSGTITDIGKVAADRSGGLPLVVVQTAASVDGFTDNVSVVLRNGVKRTIPSKWPDAVVADVQAISEAPRAMNTAGFGEFLSLFTAPADWYLAFLVGLDPSFHPAPKDLLLAAAGDLGDWSAGVASGEADATERLVRLLATRGIATGVAGTTACLSGVEHVVSHMLDLHHSRSGREIGLHGAQVGVASLVAASAWELLFEQDPAELPALRRPDSDVMRARVHDAFGHLDDGGGVAEECWRDYSAKLARIEERWDRFEALREGWTEHREELRALISPSAPLERALASSGAPARFAQLEPPISDSLARWAVANCHLMRNRFTVVDLLELLGLWTDEAIDRVLKVGAPAQSTPAEGM
jgi:glycerol-1-phosphate dehydrogenase [NAD(P)+]